VKLVPVVVTALVAAVFVWQIGWGGGDTVPDRTTLGVLGTPSEGAARTVIRAWADALRRGDVARAAAYFSLPAIVQNGTPPLRLTTRAEVRAFNASLPCGARLVRTSTSGRYVKAVFRLTERPGPGRCGSGTGQTVSTAFVVRGDKISEWRRLPDRPPPSRPSPSRPIV
jgi:hypothetical protein